MTDRPTNAPRGLEDVLREVAVAHQRIPLFHWGGGQRCSGCDSLYGEPDGPNSPRHAQHVTALQAAAIREWLTSEAVVRTAAEAMEDEAITRIGRDLGTIHRDDIARAALAAAAGVV